MVHVKVHCSAPLIMSASYCGGGYGVYAGRSYQGKLTSKIAEILPRLLAKAITKDVILKAWRVTGMPPWNPKLICERMQSPSHAVLGLLTPLASDKKIKR